MYDDALAWAGSVLGSTVVSADPLEGGLTSTMLALRDEWGAESVLRLMTNEPWRTHAVRPAEPFRTFQSWAWEAKRVVPAWTSRPDPWSRAFDLLSRPSPAYEPTFLHRDFGHRNLLWKDGSITGVVDWVETSTGPAWLDAAHAASNLAVAFGTERALAFVDRWAALSGTAPQRHWLVMDAVGYLPPPGRPPLFDDPAQLERLDEWLDLVVRIS